jgi:hypothetical protein
MERGDHGLPPMLTQTLALADILRMIAELRPSPITPIP